jgi:putative ABC transport system permease protein
MRLILDTFQDVFQYMRQYKARTFMTMFGIIWGTMTVIMLLSMGVGVGKQLSKSMHGIGEGIGIVWCGATSVPFEGYGRGRPIRMTAEDIEIARREIADIKRISPEFSTWRSAVRVGDKVNKPNLTGIIPEYGPMRNVWPEVGGRWLDELDIKHRRRVVFLGNDLRDFLFGENANAIGKYALINDTPFLVIGVLKKKTQNSSYASRDKDRAFIPATTYQAMFGNRYVSNFIYQVHSPQTSESVQQQLYNVYGKKFKFDPNDKETLHIWDTNDFDKFIFYFMIGFNGFLGVIGIITLMVGGIGLANIMYVVVQERTRETGIRRASGAKRSRIMHNFIYESLIIIGVSAMIGFILAIGVILIVRSFPVQEYIGQPELNINVAFVASLVIGIIGFVAGYFPARRASRLDVVECLRY